MQNIIKLFLVTIVFWTSFGSALASKAFQASQLEMRLKSKITELVGPRISQDRYYVIVKVDEASIPGDNKTKNVPFSSLKIDPSKLERLVNGSEDEDLLSIKYSIELVFDEKVPDKKQQLIVNEISHFFRVDGSNKKVSASKDAIVSQEINDTAAKDIEIETLKLESEKVRLERERLEFESKQKEADLLDQIKKKEEELLNAQNKAAEEIKKVNEKPKEEPKEEPKPLEEKEPTLLELAKDFQIAILAIVVGFIILISGLLSGIFSSKGMSALSKALESVGENIQAAGAKQDEKSESASMTEEALEESGSSSQKMSEMTQEAPGSNEKLQEFLLLVEEKITVLSKEGNLAFYRHFVDLIQEKPSYASAILVSVNSEVAKILVDNISTDYIAEIKNFMAQEGALAIAQQQRGAALQEFYGKISLDEFTGSPLLSITSVDWLLKLQNSDMLAIALELSQDLRSKFLACFTPSRLVSILNLCHDQKSKEDLIDAIKDIDQIEEASYSEIFEHAKQTWEKISKNREVQVKKLIDGPRFYAQLIQDLNGEEKASLIAKLSSRAELMEEIKKYYIPFTDIAKLTENTLKSIFSKRPTNQVAKIILASDQGLREQVVNVMPEMLRDTVREELTTLDGEQDKAKLQANRNKSMQLQDEICRYLLKMNREGLLNYKDQEEAESAPAAVNSAA